MRSTPDGVVLSATDLSHFLSCRHSTALDLAVAKGARKKPHFIEDPLLEILWARGAEHEKSYVDSLRASGLTAIDLTEYRNTPAHFTETLKAMHDGVDVIVQSAFEQEGWFGMPDLLLKTSKHSTLGAWSYEVADTKLARDTRAGTILQLGLYSEMLADAQGVRPEHFHVITPDPANPKQTYRVDDYAAYFRLVRTQMTAAVATGHEQMFANNYPEPVDHCDICRWNGTCREKRTADDHLSLVANISKRERKELEGRGVTTLAQLAALELPLKFKPKRGSIETYVRSREQARLQFESRGKPVPLHELLNTPPIVNRHSSIVNQGLSRLPAPSPHDLFLDLESDQFAAEGGREYLFGLVNADGSYIERWAFTDKEERAAFEWVMDEIARRVEKDPGMHVYHYAPYEPAAFKRLMGRYATRERELDVMLRAGRFIDLYAVVRQGLRAGVDRYSIKNLEPLYAYTRDVDLLEANRNLRRMEVALESGALEALPDSVRDAVKGYNRDDCVSALRLRDWLEGLRDHEIAAGRDVPRPVLETGEAPPRVDERAEQVEALRTRLLEGVPEERRDRDDAQQARWLLAYMLDYHRREDKVTWWEYFRLRDLPEEDLLDERDAVVGLEFVGEVGMRKKSYVHRYRYPAQEMEIDERDELTTHLEGKKFGEVVAMDRIARTIDILKGPSRKLQHPASLFRFTFIGQQAIEGALMRIGEGVASGTQDHSVSRSLLASAPPKLRDTPFTMNAGETPVEFARRAVSALDWSVLAIQGPPGTGKTYCGARMIVELVKQRRKVGVTANSHSVIRKLLEGVAAQAKEMNVRVKIGHKVGKDDPADPDDPIATPFAENEDACEAITSGAVDVLGGTRWLWARPEFASAVDVLFVDEAGQLSLPNAVASAQAAKSVVLLGDPQQLDQPRRGSHPDGVDASALEHLLKGALTIPPERGIFLPVTWRLAPAISAYTSELFYESRLTSREGCELQRLNGVKGLPGAGLALVRVEHDGNRNYSDEEVEKVAQLVAQLTDGSVTWTDKDGKTKTLGGSDVLVVAPYNSQVSRLVERLAGTGARAGTVDKFQGQEAPVVIYSMATSSPEDAPRGMEFLYSLNRLNVATSRAQCLAIVVASPRLFEPDCRSPRQMQLANALCRYREVTLNGAHC